jgi:hypothetical protein
MGVVQVMAEKSTGIFDVGNASLKEQATKNQGDFEFRLQSFGSGLIGGGKFPNGGFHWQGAGLMNYEVKFLQPIWSKEVKKYCAERVNHLDGANVEK